MICKYCGKEIPKGEVWNSDGSGKGYHHRCLIDMEFDKNEAYIENLKNHSIPKGATNGDMIKAMFSNVQIREVCRSELIEFTLDSVVGTTVTKDWWDAPYKAESEEM